MSLESIRARVEAATPGPWFNDYGTIGVDDHGIGEMDETPDAEFITHARTDIPALLKVAALVDEWIALSDELGRTTLADRKARSLFGKRDRAYWALRAAIAELEALP